MDHMIRFSLLGLAELGANVGEGRLQIGAERRQGGDANDRDEGSDQAVFDGGGAGLILDETSENVGHVELLLDHGLTAAFALKRLRSATNGHYPAPLADRLSR